MLSIRKIGAIGRTYRHLNRYRQIITVFIKYGIGEFIDLLKIEQYLETGIRMISRRHREQTERLSRAERVRMAFEELGPTFIKFGQILSTQPGLIPIDFVNELAKLQDNVPASSFDSIREVLETDLGAPLETVFRSIDTTPIASASIAQVYAATLASGEKVAIKVRRPHIKKKIEVDLEIMMYLAGLMERNIEEIASHKPVKIVEEFVRVLSKELDFTNEATNMERFRRQFLGDETIYTPIVFRRYTTERVLVMEYIDGIKISDFRRLEEEGYDKKLITVRGTDVTLKQVFVHGFFHADPHPGNVFILPGNVICPVDFGMMGSVTLKHREMFVDLLDALVHQNTRDTIDILLKLSIWDDEPDPDALEQDMSDFIGQYLYKPIGEMEFGKLLNHLLELLTHHRLRIPTNIFLMIKAVASIESIARQLNPDFDIFIHAAPFITRVKLARFSPGRLATEVTKAVTDLGRFTRQFPTEMLDALSLAKEGKITVNMEHKGLNLFITTLDRVSNRLAFSIIIAALLIGSAMIIAANMPPRLFGISVLGILGFLAAAIMGLWLLVSMMRKGRF